MAVQSGEGYYLWTLEHYPAWCERKSCNTMRFFCTLTCPSLSMKPLLFLVILPLQLIAQDITGLWAGTIYTAGNELPYELVISRKDDKFTGYSLTTFIIDGVENAGLKSMKIRSRNGKVTIEDDELIQDDYSVKPKRMMLFSVLTITGQDSGLILSGSFNTRAFNNANYKGTIMLKKKNGASALKVMARLTKLDLLHTLSFLHPDKEKEKIVVSSTTAMRDPEPRKGNQFAEVPVSLSKPLMPALLAPAADLQKRKIETIQTILFSADSLVLTLYDNGQVDGDTVSVVLNGETVIPRQGLSEKAITHVIRVKETSDDSLQLVMYAENLGLIPPNTGLLIIQDGDQRHEIRFSGDLLQNSAITLRRRR